MVTCTLQSISFNVYALFDPGAMFFFLTTFVAMNFDRLLDMLDEPISVSTLMGDFVVAKNV